MTSGPIDQAAAGEAIDCDVAELLAEHQPVSHGMTFASPDRCRCGAETWPASGEEDVGVRRDRAFAAHQAKVLAVGSVVPSSRVDEALVEIGGQVMTQGAFDAARYPLLPHSEPGDTDA